MSTRKLRTGLLLKWQEFIVDVHEDGGVHVRVGDQALDLTAAQLQAFRDLLDDVYYWKDDEDE